MRRLTFLFSVALALGLLAGDIFGGPYLCRRKHFRAGASEWTANGATLDPIKGNLKWYFPLGEASGNRIDLISSFAAAVANDQGNAAAKYGNGVNGGGTQLTLSHATYDTALALTASFTVFGWFKTTSTGQQIIFDCSGAAWGGTGNGGLAVWQRNDTQKINARLYGTGGASVANVVSAATYNDGNWHFFAVVYISGGSPSLTLYTDAANANTTPSAAVGDNANAAGICSSTVGGDDWAGVLDEHGFFDTNLTLSQIEALYNSGTGAFRIP